MHCWSVCETATPGITIVSSKPSEAPVLLVGEPGDGTAIPISRELHDLFERRRQRILKTKNLVEQLLSGDNSVDTELRKLLWSDLAALRRESLEKPPANWDYSDQAVAWCKESSTSATLLQTWLNSDPLRLQRLSAHEDVALVHVHTLAPLDGSLWYESNSFSEELIEVDHGHETKYEVQRKYGSFPTTGVEIVAEGRGPQGEPHVLVAMRRKASFRICRSGDPTAAYPTFRREDFDDGPNDPRRSPVLIVVWTGAILKALVPAKYQGPEQRVA